MAVSYHENYIELPDNEIILSKKYNIELLYEITIGVHSNNYANFISILINDINAYDGIITNPLLSDVNHTNTFDGEILAIVPESYIHRIQLLLANNDNYIHPYYEQWVRNVALNTDLVMEISPDSSFTEIYFKINKRYFNTYVKELYYNIIIFSSVSLFVVNILIFALWINYLITKKAAIKNTVILNMMQ